MPIGGTAGTSWIVVKADTRQAKREVDAFGRTTTSSLSATGQKLTQTGATLTKAVTLPLVGLAALAIREMAEVEKVNAQTRATIESTGGAANVTAQQVADYAGELQNLTAVDAEEIQSGQNLLLTFCLEDSAEALTKDRGWVNHSE